jgi:Cys-rich repeat protein
MRRLASLTTLSTLLLTAAALTGCPVWGPEPGRRSCDRNDQCEANQICDTATHLCVPGTPCTASSGCTSGSYCDTSRSVCTPGCGADADCASIGTGLVCNTSSHQCEPSGRCTVDRDCPMGQSCVAGSCRATSTLCQFNNQCGAGQVCIDGRCLNGCGGAVTCPSGQVCTMGHCDTPPGSCAAVTCPSGQVCSNGVCSGGCNVDMDCGSGNFCDHGVCRVDDRRPPPFCSASRPCAAGSVCRNGVCRIACPTGTNDECMRRDVYFNVCGADMVCTSTFEQNPQCQRSSECSSGQTCENAICR